MLDQWEVSRGTGWGTPVLTETCTVSREELEQEQPTTRSPVTDSDQAAGPRVSREITHPGLQITARAPGQQITHTGP